MDLEEDLSTTRPGKARMVVLVASFLALSLASTAFPRTSDFQRNLEQAIAQDLASLDEGKLTTLHALFGLTKGTRQEFVYGKLSRQDNLDFRKARNHAIALTSVASPDFRAELAKFLYGAAATRGGRAYLADAVPSIEMNAPGVLPNVAHQLFAHRGEFSYTAADGLTAEDLQRIALTEANESVAGLASLAMADPTRPAVLPAPVGGWNNDGYLVYDENEEDIHIFFQHNPFATSWNHMHWGHLVVEEDGEVRNLPIALEPRPGEGYSHNFSGSITAFRIPHPKAPSRMVTPAFWTAVGTGENGLVSFLEAPPTVMAVTGDPSMQEWEAERFTIHDKDVYRNRWDRINGDFVGNRYDMRDPILIEREGRFFLIVAGTAYPGRIGGGVIALFQPSNPDDWSQAWVYVGDMFRHPRAFDDGGPGN